MISSVRSPEISDGSEDKRLEAEQAFRSYTDNYDPSDAKIRLKIDHTFRVAEIADRIAASLSLRAEETDFAWLLGILHDIGRFEQVRLYGTFNDSKSVDHAELGADILFKKGLIRSFPMPTEDPLWLDMAEKAIRLHNKLTLPEGLSDREKLFADLLRDADKTDIFRVLSEVPYEDRSAGFSDPRDGEKLPARPYVMQCVMEHRCVPRTSERSPFEALISHACMGFEIHNDEAVRIVREEGYLWKTLDEAALDGPERAEQIRIVKEELLKEWE